MSVPSRSSIYLAPFPFSDLSAYKKRPVCVVSHDRINSGPDVVVAMVTSRRQRIDNPGLGDVVLLDWQSEGLPLQSVARASRIQTLERSLLLDHLGELTSRDLEQVDRALREVLDLS